MVKSNQQVAAKFGRNVMSRAAGIMSKSNPTKSSTTMQYAYTIFNQILITFE